jgi:hypothetical protein
MRYERHNICNTGLEVESCSAGVRLSPDKVLFLDDGRRKSICCLWHRISARWTRDRLPCRLDQVSEQEMAFYAFHETAPCRRTVIWFFLEAPRRSVPRTRKKHAHNRVALRCLCTPGSLTSWTSMDCTDSSSHRSGTRVDRTNEALTSHRDDSL